MAWKEEPVGARGRFLRSLVIGKVARQMRKKDVSFGARTPLTFRQALAMVWRKVTGQALSAIPPRAK